ncbi:MAG: RluA family pseudouridine synthase [Collinsella bouchesdurhonensis]|nr:RluA family pseudouridine synthase [Collinsella bouchesdurhonensis]
MGSIDNAHITILYQDEYFLAVDKPAGIIVHSDGCNTKTLTDQVRSFLVHDAAQNAAHDLQALNRLDRDTTGIVLFSLNKETQPAFDALIAAHDTSKHYLAICCGIPAWKSELIDAPLGRDRHDARCMRISMGGTPAQTRVSVIATRARNSHVPELSLLNVELLTGRKHQIRVHLASLGFPLLGDELYGRPVRRTGNKRYPLMLHACTMSLTHPVTHERLTIQAPIPRRFHALFPHITEEDRN